MPQDSRVSTLLLYPPSCFSLSANSTQPAAESEKRGSQGSSTTTLKPNPCYGFENRSRTSLQQEPEKVPSYTFSTIKSDRHFGSIYREVSSNWTSVIFESVSVEMWNLASSCIAGSINLKHKCLKECIECSDDDASSNGSRDEALECPICWESFNLVENVPYVLWCGHTLCKNCILGLQWAVMKFPTLPIQLPLFISCPWCNLLSFRLLYKGNLKFPKKNYFLLWMVESLNGDRVKSATTFSMNPTGQPTHTVNPRSQSGLRRPHGRYSRPSGSNLEDNSVASYLNMERLGSSLRKSLAFFVHLTAKFPLVLIFLIIVLYAIPASAAVLALYILITVLFAFPSCLILYFSYPSLDWLVREIIN
ncbi:hypothetical protein Droror1_Dr00020526 [Drosera rotundifolia]